MPDTTSAAASVGETRAAGALEILRLLRSFMVSIAAWLPLPPSVRSSPHYLAAYRNRLLERDFNRAVLAGSCGVGRRDCLRQDKLAADRRRAFQRRPAVIHGNHRAKT